MYAKMIQRFKFIHEYGDNDLLIVYTVVKIFTKCYCLIQVYKLFKYQEVEENTTGMVEILKTAQFSMLLLKHLF